MGKECGYIKVYRSLRNKGYYRDSEYVHLWVHLLMKAQFCNSEYMLNGSIHRLQAGQFITGRRILSMETGINESKIERILKVFENEHQIEQQATNKFRIISITNWAEYQNTEQQMNNKWTTNEQQVNTSNNDNNDNNNINTNGNEKKIKRVRKPKPVVQTEEKDVYCGNIWLTKKEYSRLKDEYGESMTAKLIEYLSSYKIEKDYVTKSDYRTILRWVVSAVRKKEREEKGNGQTNRAIRANTGGEEMSEEQRRIINRARERLQNP